MVYVDIYRSYLVVTELKTTCGGLVIKIPSFFSVIKNIVTKILYNKVKI